MNTAVKDLRQAGNAFNNFVASGDPSHPGLGERVNEAIQQPARTAEDITIGGPISQGSLGDKVRSIASGLCNNATHLALAAGAASRAFPPAALVAVGSGLLSLGSTAVVLGIDCYRSVMGNGPGGRCGVSGANLGVNLLTEFGGNAPGRLADLVASLLYNIYQTAAHGLENRHVLP